MSAREELLAILYGEGEHEDTREETADRILGRHAYELAEKIRAEIEVRCTNDSDGDGNCAACARNPKALCRRPTQEGRAVARAADLIDPEAE